MKLKRLLRRVFRAAASFSIFLSRRLTAQTKGLVSTASESMLAVCRFLIPVVLTCLFGVAVFDFGYNSFYSKPPGVFTLQFIFLLMLAVLLGARFILEIPLKFPLRTRLFNLLLLVLAVYLLNNVRDIQSIEALPGRSFTLKKVLLYAGITTLFLVETAHVLRFIYRKQVNPALLFVASFLFLIIIGGFLLLLPNATVNGIHPADAFFTSVSAVCVTGLVVVDTATYFTMFGKAIILFLIQLGGFGIMTFAGVVAYLLTGSVSFKNQLALGNILGSNQLGNVVAFVSRIVFVTICFEAIGAVMIYGSLNEDMFDSQWEKIFFSVFHSISAFCNAGFSTLTNGLYEGALQFNYSLQWIIAALIILGGTGFPVVFSVFSFLRIKITNLVRQLSGAESFEVYTNILPATSKLALSTTAILLVFGFCTYMMFEYDATLAAHETLFGKITTAFFGSVTPRTAGFNTVDLTALTLPTIMIYLLLMWIGASPGSTGGGIKTTVAAVAFLNVKTIVLGRKYTEIHKTEISEPSMDRAFAIIMLSLLVLGIAVLLLSVNDSEKGLIKLAFEAFSAFSTVGLTLGVTPKLSLFGKFVIMAVMFIGRVGALTLLFAVVSRPEIRYYRYPKEDIMF